AFRPLPLLIQRECWPLAPRRCCEQRLRRDLTQDELVVAEERGRNRGDDARPIERCQLLLLDGHADLFHKLVRDLPLRLNRRTELGRLHRRELVHERMCNRSCHDTTPSWSETVRSSFSRAPGADAPVVVANSDLSLLRSLRDFLLALPNPELVEQRPPLRVVLVVADTIADEVDDLPCVGRDQRRMGEQLPFDRSSQRMSG